MGTFNCRQCGAELLPETSFCRKCGAAITGTDEAASERTTTLLNQTYVAPTAQLQSRSTSPRQSQPDEMLPKTPVRQRLRPGKIVLVLVSLVLALALATALTALIRSRHGSRVATEQGLIYPGARKLMDVVADGGGRAIELDTPDALGNVVEWYRKSIQPDKVIQLTDSTVIMKNEKTTVTLVGGDNRTNVLIKTTP